MISLEGVTKSYNDGASRAVDAIDLEITERSFAVLLGESGSGKTTTLKMINRLVEPTDGRIVVAGEDVAVTNPVQLRRRIGYVFQGIGLFPHMTIADNVALVPSLLGWTTDDIQARVEELLELVGLPASEYAARYPAELSGGQQQRIGVARALAARPSVLLMDEPFGALDPITRDELQDELKKLHQALELTVVMVTHDMTEAALLADRIVVMKDGTIVGDGVPADLMRTPPNDYVARLMNMPRRQAERIEQITGLSR